tara:strand:+ start:396 stop:1505 length:1110 start_codon:yes stop_codon:yes gene_type:complete
MELKIVDSGGAPLSKDKKIVDVSGAAIETNETNKNSKGGTELMMERLYDCVDSNLLSQFQIIPSRVRELDDTKKKILWLHDLPLDPESAHLKDGGWQKFDKLVFVSHWQQQMYNAYLGVPYEAGVVLKNAIYPFEQEIDKPDPHEQLNIIYHTTPHRGLELLIPVFERVAEMYDNVHLDVFSSFNAYGWGERDEPYKDLFKAIEDHPKMTYHGFKPNDEVREALKKAHIFAYPSIWQETSCLALMEAMSAGVMNVHSNFAALFETGANWTYMYQFAENPQTHINTFGSCLIEAIELYLNKEKAPLLQQRLQMQKVYADSFYGWDSRAVEWTGLLHSILDGNVNEKKDNAEAKKGTDKAARKSKSSKKKA